METYIFSDQLSNMFEIYDEEEASSSESLSHSNYNTTIQEEFSNNFGEDFVFSDLKMSGIQMGNHLRLRNNFVYRYMLEKYEQRKQLSLYRAKTICA